MHCYTGCPTSLLQGKIQLPAPAEETEAQLLSKVQASTDHASKITAIRDAGKLSLAAAIEEVTLKTKELEKQESEVVAANRAKSAHKSRYDAHIEKSQSDNSLPTQGAGNGSFPAVPKPTGQDVKDVMRGHLHTYWSANTPKD